MTTNEKGRITLAKVLARLSEKGKHVLVPFANVGRYDLLIDNRDGTFTRVECKTARYKKGCIMFHTESRGGRGLKEAQDYSHDADVFGVWSSQTDKVYLISVKDATLSSMMIRVEEPKSKGNYSNINWAKDYEF